MRECSHDLVQMTRGESIYPAAAPSPYDAEPKRLERLGLLTSHREPGRTREHSQPGRSGTQRRIGMHGAKRKPGLASIGVEIFSASDELRRPAGHPDRLLHP